MSRIYFQSSSDDFLNSHQRWFSLMAEVFFGIAAEIMDEIHYVEQFFIKLQSIYTFACQVYFFILCHSALHDQDLDDMKGDKSVIIALTSILFYSVVAFFATKLRDLCRSDRTRPTQPVTFRSWCQWLCKILLEWAKAFVIMLCLKEQGIDYEPTFTYSFITFTYYLGTEKIFLEIFTFAVELFDFQSMENLEYLYVPLVLNIFTILAGISVASYLILVKYSHLVLMSLYFLVYLRIKDVYFNNLKPILAEKRAFLSFRIATNEDINDWADICAVCLNRMSTARITPCNHLFHPYCLKQCLRNSFNCPLCKQHFMEQVRERK